MATEPATAGCGCMLLLIPVMIAILPITIISFYIWMIVYCCKYQEKDRTTWMLITILGGPFGAIVYFFNRDKKKKS